MADKLFSKKVELQKDGLVPGAFVNKNRGTSETFSHPSDKFNLTTYIKDRIAVVISTINSAFKVGTAALPSLTFDGDTDTGIYHPAANTVGVTANGTEVARFGTAGLTITKGTVTQATNITTAVTVNAGAGVITTVSSTLAADNAATFQVNNSSVLATSVVLVSIVDYAGSQGFPVVQADAIGAGQFNVVLNNVDPSNALDGVVKIAFVVL